MSRHANAGRKLSRNTSHRKALLDNLVRAVILAESIRTTTPKAKETRRLIERVITRAKTNTLAARRIVHKTVRDQAALAKLFDTLGPRFKSRPGGYTRIIHTQNRVGDNAPMSILELVELSEKTEAPKAEEKTAKADKTEKTDKPAKTPKAEKAPKAEKPAKAPKAKKEKTAEPEKK
jgi:large subunit ribosomal protein L17